MALGAQRRIAAGFGGGHRVGTNAQKVADQAQFDQINKQTEEKKAKANAIYRNAQAIIIQLAADHALADSEREKERQSNVAKINDLRTRYVYAVLRFSTGQTSGLGRGGTNTDSARTDTASDTSASIVELPDKIAGNLRELTLPPTP